MGRNSRKNADKSLCGLADLTGSKVHQAELKTKLALIQTFYSDYKPRLHVQTVQNFTISGRILFWPLAACSLSDFITSISSSSVTVAHSYLPSLNID